MVQLQSDPVHLLEGPLFQAAQKQVVLIIMLLGVLLPICEEGVMSLGALGHGRRSTGSKESPPSFCPRGRKKLAALPQPFFPVSAIFRKGFWRSFLAWEWEDDFVEDGDEFDD
jgi:hypothetical protein